MSRGLRITVYPTGEVRVHAPAGTTLEKVERFVQEKQSWIAEQVQHFIQKLKDVHPDVLPAHQRRSKKDYREHKEQARNIITERVRHFSAIYGVSYGRIAIRNPRSRWGSCSSKGNLNFNYKLIFLPPELRDYIVVHEICHLKELNHSVRFWDLVGQTIPNYRELHRKIGGKRIS